MILKIHWSLITITRVIIPSSQVVTELTIFTLFGISNPICVGYQYQRFGMSFGVKPIYSQHLFDLLTPSAEKIEIRKIGFLTDFVCHRKPYIIPLKYLVRNYAHKWKIQNFFFTNSISASSHRTLTTTIWKSIYFNKSKRL